MVFKQGRWCKSLLLYVVLGLAICCCAESAGGLFKQAENNLLGGNYHSFSKAASEIEKAESETPERCQFFGILYVV